MSTILEIAWVDAWYHSSGTYVADITWMNIDEVHKLNNLLDMWAYGNYSCNCNRSLFFCKEDHEDYFYNEYGEEERVSRCGEGRFYIESFRINGVDFTELYYYIAKDQNDEVFDCPVPIEFNEKTFDAAIGSRFILAMQ